MAIAFDLLKGERLFKAGKKRTGVTDEQRRAAFTRLEDEWLVRGGKYWSGITDEQRRAAFARLEGNACMRLDVPGRGSRMISGVRRSAGRRANG